MAAGSYSCSGPAKLQLTSPGAGFGEKPLASLGPLEIPRGAPEYATLQLHSFLVSVSSHFLCLWLPSCDTFPSFSTKQVISLLDKFLNLSN